MKELLKPLFVAIFKAIYFVIIGKSCCCERKEKKDETQKDVTSGK